MLLFSWDTKRDADSEVVIRDRVVSRRKINGPILYKEGRCNSQIRVVKKIPMLRYIIKHLQLVSE